MTTISAIYENGVFRPVDPVRLPEHTRVEVAVPNLPSAPPTEEEKDRLLVEVRALRGSLSLPADLSDKELITAARLEKHGPL